ncbi:MAG TPA: histidine kinase dimerization/phosphoacceptor domain -containing protein, partial [Coleofasciculaceae cyanobacterium]
YVNREIAQILGYTPTEIHAMGSSVLPILMHPDDFAKIPKNLERIYTAADGEILKWEYRMRCANGEWRWIYSHETIFTRTAEGAVQQIIGTAEDISDRKQAEEQIRASLAEKEVLLREIHHRVKNNLNVIHSLLNMQARTIEDPVTKNLLLDSQKRLQTMALIHEQLYQSQSLANIDFAEYIHRLANNLFAAANLNHDLIKLKIKADSVDLNLETAIPCGLIINELLTNAFKHAFPEGRSGIIRMEFYRDHHDTLHLTISDNGVGLPVASNLYKKTSLGMRLVKILVQQLRAKLEISCNQGASFHLSFIQIT